LSCKRNFEQKKTSKNESVGKKHIRLVDAFVRLLSCELKDRPHRWSLCKEQSRSYASFLMLMFYLIFINIYMGLKAFKEEWSYRSIYQLVKRNKNFAQLMCNDGKCRTKKVPYMLTLAEVSQS
jgi:hypothetical protein